MTTVKMLRNISLDIGQLRGDDEYKLPDQTADALIADGSAELVRRLIEAPSELPKGATIAPAIGRTLDESEHARFTIQGARYSPPKAKHETHEAKHEHPATHRTAHEVKPEIDATDASKATKEESK